MTPAERGTFVLSAASFVMSGCALGWTMFRDLADKGALRVGCFVGKIFGGGVQDDRNYIVWSITNSGRRPIVLEHVGGEYLEKGKNFIIVPHGQLPRTLQPGETMTEYSPQLEELERVKSLCVWDTLGRVYRAPGAKLKKTKAEAKRIRQGSNAAAPAIRPEDDY